MPRLIDADALPVHKAYCVDEAGWGANFYVADKSDIDNAPTIDAVPVDAVAQMLFDLFGDGCPCNYNDIAEWLGGSNGCTENCDKNEDPLLCWKLFIRHYGERRSDD